MPKLSTKVSRPPLAFSLIEILAVIAVIGIIASILVPVVSRTRSMARTSQCQASLRSIGNTFQLFAVDHSGHLPVARGTEGEGFWYVQIAPYLSELADDPDKTADQKRSIRIGALAVCPDAFFPDKNVDPKGIGASYGWNFAGGSPVGSGEPLQSIEQPGKTILLGERWAKNSSNSRDSNFHVKPPWITTPLNSDATEAGGDPAALRLSHQGRSNFLFFDGHVDCLTPEETYVSASSNLWRRN